MMKVSETLTWLGEASTDECEVDSGQASQPRFVPVWRASDPPSADLRSESVVLALAEMGSLSRSGSAVIEVEIPTAAGIARGGLMVRQGMENDDVSVPPELVLWLEIESDPLACSLE